MSLAKLINITAKLLTGFDAPILQAMYLDKPLRDHTLLQAICRVNRTYSDQKTHGLIVDYLGFFDDVAAALEFDDQSVKQVVSNIQELKDKLPEAMQKCLGFFTGCDRSLQGYEGLIAAQQCLPNNEVRDNFAGAFSLLNKLWEAISPDTILGQYEKDYKWLSQVYQSVQPSSGHGKLIWHSLGAKTIELIHQNVHVDAVRDDLDTLEYYFRQGFQRGYQDGANSRYRDQYNNNSYGQYNDYEQQYQYGTRSNGVLNVLGSILGQILNIQPY